MIIRRVGILILALMMSAPAYPVRAQDMGENGMTLPAFFFSRAEQLARQACEQKTSNCRPAVRDRMELERNISLLLPWIAGALGFAYLLYYFHKKEQQKEAHRRMAQRRHVPGAYKTLDKDKREEEAKAQRARDRDREEEDERFR
ncbi:MAG: hypothetical protein SFV19_18225 [Rhodospirillaceae bacterium]|nr:hypothetical protein [Rhodospirillaceae bacterium]